MPVVRSSRLEVQAAVGRSLAQNEIRLEKITDVIISHPCLASDGVEGLRCILPILVFVVHDVLPHWVPQFDDPGLPRFVPTFNLRDAVVDGCDAVRIEWGGDDICPINVLIALEDYASCLKRRLRIKNGTLHSV